MDRARPSRFSRAAAFVENFCPVELMSGGTILIGGGRVKMLLQGDAFGREAQELNMIHVAPQIKSFEVWIVSVLRSLMRAAGTLLP